MATESSAVVRFINLVQQEAIRETAQPASIEPTLLVESRRSRKPLFFGLSAITFAVLTLATGVYLGRTVLAPSASGGPSSAAAPALSPESVEDQETQAPAAEAQPAARATPPEEGRPAAEPALAAADLGPATGFDLRVEPAGASVSLDGKLIGLAPLGVRNVAPGAHSIGIEAPSGYFSKHLEVTIEAGKAESLRVALEPIEAEPSEASPAGDSEVDEERAKADQGRARRRERVEKRRAARRAARAVRSERPAVSGTGTLMLGAKPPCDIYIDGAKTGLKTPQRSIELSAGRHRITLVNNEFGIRKRIGVKIEPGKTTRVVKDLTGSI